MLNVKDFLKMLRTAHDVPNYYCNKYPKNLGYFDGKRYSFDCWNLIKVVLSGWQPGGAPGSFFPAGKLVTGDVDGSTILKSCTERSKDFTKISVPGTYLYLSTSPHAGIFIGEFEKDGKVYNAIECTKGMYQGQDGVTYSYVDKDGTRRAWKGGNAKGKWTDYGLLTKYVDYNVEGDPIPLPPGDDKKENPDPKDIPAYNEPEYYTIQSGDTLSGIAKKFKVKQSKLLELNPQIKNPNLIYAGEKMRIK